MRRAAILVSLLLAATAAEAAPTKAGARAARSAGPAERKARPAAPRTPRTQTFAEANAAMKALMRDRTRRKYRHHWEKAIGALLATARGKDRPAALLEAARARYALYRWSADEADREKALLNAQRAARAGSREAVAFAAAVRREAGDERPARAPARPARPVPARPEPTPAPPADEDSPPDPELEKAVADLLDGAPPVPAPGAAPPGAPAHVADVRTWSGDDYARVAIYLTRPVEWQKLELPASGDLPRRLALDLKGAVLDGSASARPVSGAQIERVRFAQHATDTVRVVLDLPDGRADEVEIFALQEPPRLIVDVGARPRADAVATAPAAPAAPAPAAGPEADRSPIRRIVVDAGHGGHDPGAIGPTRLREKDVTLAMAKRLAAKLRAAGFQVVLTRSGDRYLALEERTAIANSARGDLFVSIHANAHPRRNRTGVETYFLNVADDRYAARLAARENGMELSEGAASPDVHHILADLDAKASAQASRRLAGLVQRELVSSVRARIGETRDLGVKSALFYVLLGARMPAVLVETGFISNRVEERRLRSKRYQEEVASAISRAVTAYARQGDRVAAR